MVSSPLGRVTEVATPELPPTGASPVTGGPDGIVMPRLPVPVDDCFPGGTPCQAGARGTRVAGSYEYWFAKFRGAQ